MPSKPVDSWKSKRGGTHTTLIGDRSGRKIASLVASHDSVKKIVPGIIQSKGPAGGSFRAKVLRPDNRGNLRLLFTQGTSYQEIMLVTTASNLEKGEAISDELNKLIEIELNK
jgi:Predicted metal-binding protein